MAGDRPPIPDPTARQVRQRCGFGCAICGDPLYQYDHIIDYSVVREHHADNLTLLCVKHHTEKTKKLLTQVQVERANANPINVQRGISSPYGLHFEGTRFDVEIGGNKFFGGLRDNQNCVNLTAISIDDVDLLSFKIDSSGKPFSERCIFDRANFPLLGIFENRVICYVSAWDVEFIGHKLTVRDGPGKILFEIDFLPPNAIVIDRAHLLCNGIEILVRPSHIYILNSDQYLSQCTADNCQIGLQLGRNQRGLASGFSADRDSLCRYLLSESEVTKRENEAIRRMTTLFEEMGIDPSSNMPS